MTRTLSGVRWKDLGRYGAGKLLKAPEVRYGRITGALERKHAGKQIVVVEHIATVDSMDKGPCGLSADL